MTSSTAPSGPHRPPAGVPDPHSPSVAPRQPAAARVLLVDDEPGVLLAHARALRTMGHEVADVGSPLDALALLRTMRFDVLMADVRMPEMSGLELATQAIALDPELATIMITALNDAAVAARALLGGVMDYVTKPVTPEQLDASVRGALQRREQLREQRRAERAVREEVALRTAELEREKRALRDMTVSVAESLITAMEAKDVYLHGHSHRVAALAATIAEELGLHEDTVEQVRLAGRLHDVGKIGIREAVLNKPGPLDPAEYEHVKQHVRIGMEILTPLRHLGDALTYVHHHHEHWDGSGYPQGLHGDAISLGGRIVCAADAFDALTSARAYREPLSPGDALAIIAAQTGRLLDPDVQAALRRVVGQGQSLVFLDPVA